MRPGSRRHHAIQSSRLWVERVVLGLSLCPWALPVYEQGAIRYAFTEARLPDARGERRLLETALQECSLLSSATGHSTTIIVAPDASPDDFRVFLDACGEVESALAEAGLDAAFQAVAFHPLFCFAGEPADDPGNFVNRSPHPMLHLLRQDDVTAALGRGRRPPSSHRSCSTHLRSGAH